MLSAAEARALVDVPVAELVDEAGRLRDLGHGNRVTFSPKVFIPLTMLCRDRCGYCTFAKPPARLDAPYLSLDDVLDIARRGAAVGCHEALFTLGEAPEERYSAARAWLEEHGYGSTVDYLVDACRRGSSRTSCPSRAQPCTSTRRAIATSSCGPSRRRGSCSAPACTSRRPPT